MLFYGLKHHFSLWHEQTGIIFQTAFGILHIDAIKENFFCDFLKIASVGYTGYLRRKRGLGYGYQTMLSHQIIFIYWLKVVENNDVFELKEPIAPYNAHLHTKNDLLSHENMYYCEGSIINSTS